MKKFHDRFPTKQKNHSFKINGGKFLVLASSALGIISPLHWSDIQLRNPRACSAHLFPPWKCAWVAGETAGSSATENGRKTCLSCTLPGPVPYCSPVFWRSILNFCQLFPLGVFIQWTGERKKTSDRNRLFHIVSGHIYSHVSEGRLKTVCFKQFLIVFGHFILSKPGISHPKIITLIFFSLSTTWTTELIKQLECLFFSFSIHTFCSVVCWVYYYLFLAWSSVAEVDWLTLVSQAVGF